VRTTDQWFQGPDGDAYKAVWGVCAIIRMEDAFGFTPARPSANWFLSGGSEDNHVIIAGCQIHYAVRSEKRPVSKYEGRFYKDTDTGLERHAERIYFTE